MTPEPQPNRPAETPERPHAWSQSPGDSPQIGYHPTCENCGAPAETKTKTCEEYERQQEDTYRNYLEEMYPPLPPEPQGEASADTKRLDWLEAHRSNAYEALRLEIESHNGSPVPKTVSLRAAIDAALRPNDVATEAPGTSTENQMLRDELKTAQAELEHAQADHDGLFSQLTALRAELAKVRAEAIAEAALCEELLADRARLEAACLALKTFLESLRADIASDVIEDSDKDRTARRLSQIQMIGHALSSTAGDELRGVLKQAHGALTHAVENCAHCTVLPTSVGEAYFDAPCLTCQLATAALAALSRFLPQEEP